MRGPPTLSKGEPRMRRSGIMLGSIVLGTALLAPALVVRSEDAMKPMDAKTMEMGHSSKKPIHKKATDKKPMGKKAMDAKPMDMK